MPNQHEHEFEVSRHKPARAECVAAGYDYPHESPDPNWTLAGELLCPACQDRLIEKQSLQVQMEANDLKDRELTLREAGAWAVETAPYRRAYVMPPPLSEQPTKGGQFVAPTRPNTSE